MPELPEIEITCKSFAHRIQGAHVTGVRLGKPLRWPLGRDPYDLQRQTIGEVSRRAKYLWLPMSEGGLLIHLGMSGSLTFREEIGPAGPHDHFDLITTRGTLRLTDPRRFGCVVWSKSQTEGHAGKLLSGLGIEPFDNKFTGTHLYSALQQRHLEVKLALLSGKIVVGAGNIYACEALFSAGIDPRTHSNRISRNRCERLALAVRETLARAVAAGGSTLRNFHDAHGVAGEFQLQTKVYGREGLACLQCSSPIRRITQGQRSTFFCPHCQRK